jgi:ribonucleoside-diphosphate reductase alpha chain
LLPNTRNLIAEQGIRNGTLLTIAPVGTGSLYYGDISSGLEPVFHYKGKRNVLQADGSRKAYDTENYGYRLYQSIHGVCSRDDLPDYMVTADELPVGDHIRIQAAAQEWVDASVSKTINCPSEISFEEFMDVYNLAYDLGCKGCTTYRPNPMRGSVLEGEDGDDGTPLVPKLPKRPDTLEGRTYKITWPSLPSALYLTVNRNEEAGGFPFEVFINSRSSLNAEWMTALTLMISAIMRMSNDVEFIAQELQQVVSAHDSAWIDGKYYGSLVARIGKVLGEHFEAEGILSAAEIPTKQEPSPAPQEIRSGETVTLTNGGGVKITAGAGSTADVCPACGAPTLIHQEGCAKCTQCDYSNCG